MNLGNALLGAAIGYATGGPGGALAGGFQGAMGANGNTAVGNGANGVIGGMNAVSEADNAALMGENLRHQSAMQWQSTWFNEMMDEKSEKMRQMNELRDLDMEQRKADNQITKKFIASVME
ncbi:MAG: hypothetical protein ABR584_02070 [Candidatus Baltobacteraceae bacterium]